MTDVGELVVRIKADATQLQQELQKITASIRQTADGMTAAFDAVKSSLEAVGIGLSIGAFVEFGKSALESADNLEHMSQRIGFAADTLSALQIPLKQNGSDIDQLAASVNILDRNIGLAATGDMPKLLDVFDKLHLSVTVLKSMRPEDAFSEVIKALGNTKDQFELADRGRALFSRNFASMEPMLKAIGFDIQAFVEKARQTNSLLSPEEIEKVHQWDAAWVSASEHAKIYFVEALVAASNFFSEMTKHQNDASFFASKFGVNHGDSLSGDANMSDAEKQAAWESKSKSLGFVTSATRAPSGVNYGVQFGPTSSSQSASGNNDNLRQPPKDSELKAYIANLNQETAALGLNAKALAVSKAEIEGSAKAKADFDNGIRSSKDLTDNEKQQIDALASSYYDLKIAQQQAEQQAKKMQETISSSLADMATDWKNAGASISSVLKSLANDIIKSQITNPLSKAIVGDPASGQSGLLSSIFGSGSGIGKIFGFASGGSPPVGVPSMVGENGPELFVPNTAGTIIPNGGLGGSSVKVYQSINLSPGLAETVNAAIMNAAPAIAGMAHAGVMQALQKGGSESKIAGLRNS